MELQNLTVMEIVTDEKEIARAQMQRQFYRRNFAWFQAHSNEIYRKYHGKCVAVAGCELFVGDAPEDVWKRAEAAHPNDKGIFIHYIPKEKANRIYGNWR